jgi:fibronectin type 3 domain-containing protein
VKKTLVTIVFCLISTSIAEKLPSESVFYSSGSNSISLRWFIPEKGIPKYGFRIYRSDLKINFFEVKSPNTQLLSPKNKGSYEKYLQGFTSLPKTKGEKARRFFAEAYSLTDLDFCKYLGTLFEDRDVKPGVKYKYRLVAKTENGESEIGQIETKTSALILPKFPAKPTSDLTQDKVGILWNYPEYPEENPIVTFRIYRAEANQAFSLITPSGYFGNAKRDANRKLVDRRISFTDPAVKPDTVYQYAITSVDIFGRESAKSPPITVDTSSMRPLLPPALGEPKSSDDKITLSWPAVQDKRITKITVLRGLNPDKLEPFSTLPANAIAFTDAKVRGGTDYYYALVVQNAAGDFSVRSLLQATRAFNATPPATPANVTLKPGTDRLELSWKPNPEPDIRGYLVFRAPEGAAVPFEKYELVTSTVIPEAKFADLLPAGLAGKFTYRMVAINTTNVRSKPSEPVTGMLVDKSPPPSPVLLDVSGLDDSIGLAWSTTKVPDLDHYEIFRIGPLNKLEFVASTKPNATGYVDKTVIPNVSYAYAIYSVDKLGNRSEASNSLVARAFLSKPPETPKGFKLTVLKDGVKLEWQQIDRPIYYVVYRLEGETLVQIAGPLEAKQFVDATGKVGVKYVLRAIDLSGNLSEPTAAIQAK